jgi:hypothetical protein
MEKKKPFKLEEKDARLDIRIRASLRTDLEKYCLENDTKLTEAVTKAIREFLSRHSEKKS